MFVYFVLNIQSVLYYHLWIHLDICWISQWVSAPNTEQNEQQKPKVWWMYMLTKNPGHMQCCNLPGNTQNILIDKQCHKHPYSVSCWEVACTLYSLGAEPGGCYTLSWISSYENKPSLCTSSYYRISWGNTCLLCSMQSLQWHVLHNNYIVGDYMSSFYTSSRMHGSVVVCNRTASLVHAKSGMACTQEGTHLQAMHWTCIIHSL